MIRSVMQEISNKNVAANFETVVPKRDTTAANNAQRETVASQAKASERAQSAIVGSQDGDPAVNDMKWIDERYFKILQESTSQESGLSKTTSSIYELDRLGVTASAVNMAAKARHEQLMRALLFLSS